MNNALNPSLRFLDASQLLSAASSLDAIHARTIKTIERLQRDVDARKTAAASRWKGTAGVVSESDRRRLEEGEVRAAIIEIKRAAEKELDAILKEAGAAHVAAVSQRPFYDSPVKTLNRVTLGDARRGEYLRQLEHVGPAELAHLGQFAVSTANLALAAAVVSRLDSMPAGSRPFSAVQLAQALGIEEHTKGSEAIKIADARLQAILVAIRAWKAGSSNPLDAVHLALRERTLDAGLLEAMEADDDAR